MIDVTKLKTATEARNLMENAKKHERLDLYRQAFRRLGEIEGKAACRLSESFQRNDKERDPHGRTGKDL